MIRARRLRLERRSGPISTTFVGHGALPWTLFVSIWTPCQICRRFRRSRLPWMSGAARISFILCHHRISRNTWASTKLSFPTIHGHIVAMSCGTLALSGHWGTPTRTLNSCCVVLTDWIYWKTRLFQCTTGGVFANHEPMLCSSIARARIVQF